MEIYKCNHCQSIFIRGKINGPMTSHMCPNCGNCMNNYNKSEQKIWTVGDFANHTNSDIGFIIIDNYKNTGKLLYDNKQEHLAWSVANELCNRVVESFDISTNGKIILYLAKG